MTRLGKSVSFLVIILLVSVSFFVFKSLERDVPEPIVLNITNFEECASAGYPILESYPDQCRTPDGQNFVRVIEEPVVVPETVEFGKEITFKINDSRIFSDGLTVNLKEINDSRCKPDVQCIWAGNLSVLLSVSGGKLLTKEELELTTTPAPWSSNSEYNTKTIQGYTFTLKSATENTATISVSTKNPSNVAFGYIKGQVNIGPFCPVEREGEPCVVPWEAYSSREVYVYLADKKTIKEKLKIEYGGHYETAITPGNYFLQVVPAGIGEGEKKPVTVKSSQTSTVNFDIDTGIR